MASTRLAQRFRTVLSGLGREIEAIQRLTNKMQGVERDVNQSPLGIKGRDDVPHLLRQ